MSILFMDGFDHYNVGTESAHTSKWSTSDADWQAVTGAHGDGQGLYASTNANTTGLFNASASTVIVGFYFHARSDPDTFEEVFYLREGATAHVMAEIDPSTGLIALRNGAESVVYCTSGTALTPSTWHHLEFKFYIHASAGTAELKIDGVSVCSATGLDTYASGTGEADRVEIHSNAKTDSRYDHFYCLSGDATAPNDFIGPCKIAVLSPATDQSPNQFTATGAGSTNADRVSETLADSDTTYVSSTTVGHQELYTVSAMPANVGTIHGAQVVTTAKKDGATTRTWRNNLTSNVTSVDGATQTATESYKCGIDVYETDPDTGVAWTESGIEAAQIGFEIVS